MSNQDALAPGLMVVHANQLEELRALAVTWMRRYPLAPLENEVILVQSNGIAQWLKLALAEDSSGGIAAAIQVDLPARFLWQTYRSVLGSDTIPQQSPLDKAPLTWRLMRLLPQLFDDARFAALAHFLEHDSDGRKRYQLAERLADLFDQYQVYRADWLAEWDAGRDQIICARGKAQPLTDSNLWQPALWRALLADVGHEQLAGSRAGVHPRFVEQLTQLAATPDKLPRRVIVFGISSLPAQTLEALAAMSRFSQVLLCVHNPCQYHWGDIVADQDLLRHQFRRHARKAGQPLALNEADLHQHAHPLLAAWGKQGRDYINLLDSIDDPEHYRERFAAMGSRIDLFSRGNTTHLLGQLQDDILNLRPLSETREHWPAITQDSASIRFHIAHSAQREVEVLHDQLLAAFSQDDSLRPRDIMVMVPDINQYAPHIQAVFGQYARDDERYIPFTLSDQGSRGTAPLLIALEQLLQLPDNRQTVSEILDLLEVPALRERFGIAEQDIPTLHRWIAGAGIRWGLDAERRRALGMPASLEQNTWRFGLRRMLLGYAVGVGEAYQDIAPFDEIGGLDAALIGPLVKLLDTLDKWHRLLSEPASPSVWGQQLHQLLADCFMATSDHDHALLTALTDGLEQWQTLCDEVALDEALPLTIVREAWLGAIDEGRLSQRFMAGAINFCTLMPMRAIPFRHICLLGMNDGDYPRSVTPLSFDLMANDYRPGDRSRREDDRYLLLEALLSAREQLYISWVGRSIVDNSERPASVLVGQLRDHIAAGWRWQTQAEKAEEDELLLALTTEHPLQPFSPQYFRANSQLFSYAYEWALVHQNAPSADTLALPPLVKPEGAWLQKDLGQLQHFLRNPVAHFFTQRLKVYLDEAPVMEQDEEPFTLAGLDLYSVKRQLLNQARLTLEQPQRGLEQALAQLARQGQLPLAGFGEVWQASLLPELLAQLSRYQLLLQSWPTPVLSPLLISAEHAQISVTGWLGDLYKNAAGLVHIELTPGTLLNKNKSPKWHRLLPAFVAQVLANAQGEPLTSILVGEDETITMPPLAPAVADEIVKAWLTGWREGLEAPLPVALNTAMAALAGKKETELIKEYEGGFKHTGERDRCGALSRHYPDFAALTADNHFSDWCQRLYQPLYEHNPVAKAKPAEKK